MRRHRHRLTRHGHELGRRRIRRHSSHHRRALLAVSPYWSASQHACRRQRACPPAGGVTMPRFKRSALKWCWRDSISLCSMGSSALQVGAVPGKRSNLQSRAPNIAHKLDGGRCCSPLSFDAIHCFLSHGMTPRDRPRRAVRPHIDMVSWLPLWPLPAPFAPCALTCCAVCSVRFDVGRDMPRHAGLAPSCCICRATASWWALHRQSTAATRDSIAGDRSGSARSNQAAAASATTACAEGSQVRLHGLTTDSLVQFGPPRDTQIRYAR